MRRRRSRERDDRLDWRDPNMPVLRQWVDQFGKVSLREISPNEEKDHCELGIALKESVGWRDDPTYDLAKRRRQR